ncbi:hypothetical protein SaSA201_1090 [Streptococcus agalactiae]|nr:hypothetical protein SaSA20_1047 [Streptococcus agalactiae]EJZ03663.1 peptide ABC transporter ATPase [Streptococcus agalactiae STIR-CD-17]EPW86301.1 peptide ABC transporter ATPase [Streptococcus agalactiae STIR-CD-07]ANI27478.1 hypothetical protein A9J19_05750 [Streptococcus agalactiae]APO41907.1 hypothetical protein BTH44_05795 [Streptococcus agalactiae]
MLNIIGKLEAIDSGTILVNGINLNKSYLFQNFGLIDNRTIQENLELASVDKKIVMKLLS